MTDGTWVELRLKRAHGGPPPYDTARTVGWVRAVRGAPLPTTSTTVADLRFLRIDCAVVCTTLELATDALVVPTLTAPADRTAVAVEGADIAWRIVDGAHRAEIALRDATANLFVALTVPAPLAADGQLELQLKLPYEYAHPLHATVAPRWAVRGFLKLTQAHAPDPAYGPLTAVVAGGWERTLPGALPVQLFADGGASCDPPLASTTLAGRHRIGIALAGVPAARLPGGGELDRLYTVEHSVAVPTVPPLWPFAIAPRSELRARVVLGPVLRGASRSPWRLDAPCGAADAVAAWNRIAQVHRSALVGARARTKPSVVPTLTITGGDQAWICSYHLEYRGPGAWSAVRTRLRPVGGDLRVTARLGDGALDGLRDHDGRAVERAVSLGPLTGDGHHDWDRAHDDEIPAASTGDDTRAATHHVAFGLTAVEASASASVVRVGALDLHLGGVVPGTTARVMATGNRWHAGAPASAWVHVDELRLGVVRLAPGAQDPTEAEAQGDAGDATTGILIPVDAAATAGAAPFHVTFRETSSMARDHRLTLELERRPEAAAPASHVFIVDDRPLLVARAEVDLSGLTSATWSSLDLDGAAWRIVDGDRAAQLQLPPQVVGEEMIKHYGERAGFTPTLAALRMKFAAPTRVELDRSELATASAELPWNLRRLLGWAGQRHPGSTVTRLETELLYGLTTTLAHPDGLRLVELATAIGGLPRRRTSDRQVLAGFLARVRADAGLTRARPSLAYLAREGALDRRAEVADGLTFEFRKSREVAHPLAPTTPDLEPASERGAPTRYHKPDDGFGGLPGGVDWGFESRNVYEQVLRSSSTGGTLADVAFTALGGFGQQKASFANGLSRIYSITELGRTSYYALERIGRIGCLWHPFRHVIVYQRTVGASWQFPDAHGAWSQHPVIRKVEEYLQPIEPVRRYPDDASPEATRGFVLGASFEDTKIPVDSAWGRDVPGGWIIPLWRPGQASYRRPDVRLILAIAGGEEKGAIGNPEDLYFYTATDDGVDADPTRWPAVAGIDFPAADLDEAEQPAAAATDDVLPPAAAVRAGLAPFTFRIERMAARVDVAAARATSAIEAALENVSLARRSVKKLAGAAASLDPDAAAVQAQLAVIGDAAAQFAASASQVVRGAPAELERARDAVTAALSTAATAITTTENQIAARITDAAAAARRRWDEQRTRAVAEATAAITALVASGAAATQVAPVMARLAAAVESARPVYVDVDHRVRAARQVLGEVGARADATAASVTTVIEAAQAELASTSEAVRRAAAARVVAQLARLTDVARAELATLAARSAQLAPPQWGQAAAAVLATATVRMPQEAEDLVVWARGLNATAVVAELVGPLTEARTRFDDALTTIEKASRDELDAWRKEVARCKQLAAADLDALVAKAQASADELRAEVEHTIEDLVEKVGALPEGLAAAVVAASGIDDGLAAAKAGVAAVFEFARELQRVAAQHAAVAATAHAWVDRLGADAGRALTAVAGRVEQRLADATTAKLRELAPYGEPTLRLVRAFGAAPVAEALRLNRDRVAYTFHQLAADGTAALSRVVGLSPSTVLFNRPELPDPGRALQALGVRLPTRELAERFLPDLRAAIDLPKLFPDFAGLRLDSLFADVLPSLDGVAIRHGFDTATRRAWAACDVAVPISSARLFALGPFEMTLGAARFAASTRVEADASGGVRKTVDGTITGSWRFAIGGTQVVALNDATLAFDDHGHLRFRMSPQGITIHEALRFLTRLLSYAPTKPGNGLTVTPVAPAGIRAAIELMLPTLQTGAFAISNLGLATYFELQVGGGDGFVLSAGLNLASPERPFNLSVLFLGGGGWFNTSVRYAPFAASGPVAIVDVGIAVGASLMFDIGVAAGGVSLLLSAGVRWQLGGGGSLVLTLALTLRGEVVILGIVSVGLMLRLEARYTSGGDGLQCRGYLSISIKIGWFFKIKVQREVTFTLAGGGGGSKSTDQTLADYHAGYEG